MTTSAAEVFVGMPRAKAAQPDLKVLHVKYEKVDLHAYECISDVNKGLDTYVCVLEQEKTAYGTGRHTEQMGAYFDNLPCTYPKQRSHVTAGPYL